MPKPPTSVRSIRLSDDLWALLQGRADALGVSLNRYVVIRLESARTDARKGPAELAFEPAPKDLPRPGETFTVSRPSGEIHTLRVLERKPFNPQPKKGKK